jgi:membrane protease YdiL (CAAX protease family)
VFGWSVLGGTLAVIALCGLWIVLVQLVKMPGNALPDYSRYPLFTVICLIVMSAVAAPLTEEPAFRGYCQVILERNFSGPAAVLLSSVVFALAHGPTQGLLWPKLLFYFLVGVAFGTTARLTNSILPAVPGHVLGLLIFFTFIWPHDAERRQVWDGGTDFWFWAHLAQTILFAALAVWAFLHLAQTRQKEAITAAEPASMASR